MFGLKITVSDHALKDGDVRLFPESRNRSPRIRKKLLRRFGGEFKQVPAVYHVGDMLVAHPAVYHRLKQEIENECSGAGYERYGLLA